MESQWLLVAAVTLLVVGCGDGEVCPGGRTECDESETCCARATGDYGCCGTPHATCCPDLVHCCPQGFYCDATAQECKREGMASGLQLPFLTLQQRSVRRQNAVRAQLGDERKAEDVRHAVAMELHGRNHHHADGGMAVLHTMCPDGHDCPGNETCCLQRSGLYGCCSLQRATCCTDGIHCCPEDFRCVINGTHAGCEEALATITHEFAPSERNL